MKKLFISMLATICIALQSVANEIPRKEYPRPQFVREAWVNLNGQWDYTFDFVNSGKEKGYQKATSFDGKITVPFCPESKLSGVGHTDFINHIWYHRSIEIPQAWEGKKILLNFGAVYYTAEIYIDGQIAGRHFGGSSSFAVDITPFVKAGQQHHLVVKASSDLRSGLQSAGKQSLRHGSHGCNYTRTTGIWQTVWMEAVAYNGLQSAQVITDIDQSQIIIRPQFYAEGKNTLKVTLKDGNKTVATAKVAAMNSSVAVLPVKKAKLWSPESPFLYDLIYQLTDDQGNVIDEVNSYVGMRKIHIEGNKIYLNNQPYYQRLVLDQGFYPDGIWTAPSDEALKKDIELSMAAGFNGARLHQKVFEERFYYWADKMGYLTWGEAPSWGMDANNVETARNFLTEWEETVVRDRNHPSIIMWTPFNETWEHPDNREAAREACRFVSDVYDLTRNLDYRPCHDVSGNYHVKTDIFSVHQYEQDPGKFSAWIAPVDGKVRQHDLENREVEYDGQPYLVDEYGGIKWVVGQEFSEISWGYGNAPKTIEEVYERMEDLTDAILYFDHICGYCYTQLTDVEQEQNGIYNYDRTEKFDMDRIRAIFSKVPKGFK